MQRTHTSRLFGVRHLGAVGVLCCFSLPAATPAPDLGLLPKAERIAQSLLSASLSDSTCGSTTQLLAWASVRDLQVELIEAAAYCINFEDPRDAEDCIDEAWNTYTEGLEFVVLQSAARNELCQLLGGGAYDPDIDERDFSAVIDNPLLPLPVGLITTFESLSDEGLEVSVNEVLNQTITIDEVECRVVHAVVTLDGVLVEDTFDYYAQDEDGNVWYFGERVQNYEEGVLASLNGSWIAGVDGAQPGIIMLAQPSLGTAYRQEFAVNEAEDAALVLGLEAQVSVPFGDFRQCLQTRDWTPIEPTKPEEQKFFAAGIGLVLELHPATGERNELVSVVYAN